MDKYSIYKITLLSNKEINHISGKLINKYPLKNDKDEKILYRESDFLKLDYYYRIIFNKPQKLFKHIQDLFLNFTFYEMPQKYIPKMELYFKNLSVEECSSIIINKCIKFCSFCDFLKNNIVPNTNSIYSWMEKCNYLFDEKHTILSNIIKNSRIIFKKKLVIQIIRKLSNIKSEPCIDLILNYCNFIDSDIIIELIKCGHILKEQYLRNIELKDNFHELFFNIHRNTYSKNTNFCELIENSQDNNKYWNYHIILNKMKYMRPFNHINISEKDFRTMIPLKFIIKNLDNNSINSHNYYLDIINKFNYDINRNDFEDIILKLFRKDISTNLFQIYKKSCK